jgi:hypothetical protein
MSISVIPTEAELRRIRARVTEVAWMIRALNTSRLEGSPQTLLNLVESWPDHQVQSLAAMLVAGEKFESREAALEAVRDLVKRKVQLLAELLSEIGGVGGANTKQLRYPSTASKPPQVRPTPTSSDLCSVVGNRDADTERNS